MQLLVRDVRFCKYTQYPHQLISRIISERLLGIADIVTRTAMSGHGLGRSTACCARTVLCDFPIKTTNVLVL